MPRGVSPYDEAKLQGRLWHPRLYGATCHFDPACGVIPGPAMTWKDRIGGNVATLTTGAGSMVFAPGSINGCPSIFSPNSNGSLSLGKSLSISQHTIAFIAMAPPGSGNVITLGGENSEYLGSANADFLLYRGGDDNGMTTGSLITPGTPYIGVFSLSQGMIAGYFNDQVYCAFSGAQSPIVFTRIGSRAAYSQFSTGYFGDIIVFPRVLSRRGMSAVAAMLAWKYRVRRILGPQSSFANRPPLIGD